MSFWQGLADDGLLPRKCDVKLLAETATVLAHADTYLLLHQAFDLEPRRVSRGGHDMEPAHGEQRPSSCAKPQAPTTSVIAATFLRASQPARGG